MAKVKNHHRSALGLPDGTVIPAGETVDVANWNEVKDNAVVKAWIDHKVLVVGKAKDDSDEDEDKADQAPDKEALKAKLDALGVQYDKRAGVAKLQALLADAEQAKG
jgi:hypothetical protein